MKLTETFMRFENVKEWFDLTVNFDHEDQTAELLTFELVKGGKTTDITELARYVFDLEALIGGVDWRAKSRQVDDETMRYFNARERRGLNHYNY